MVIGRLVIELIAGSASRVVVRFPELAGVTGGPVVLRR